MFDRKRRVEKKDQLQRHLIFTIQALDILQLVVLEYLEIILGEVVGMVTSRIIDRCQNSDQIRAQFYRLVILVVSSTARARGLPFLSRSSSSCGSLSGRSLSGRSRRSWRYQDQNRQCREPRQNATATDRRLLWRKMASCAQLHKIPSCA